MYQPEVALRRPERLVLLDQPEVALRRPERLVLLESLQIRRVQSGRHFHCNPAKMQCRPGRLIVQGLVFSREQREVDAPLATSIARDPEESCVNHLLALEQVHYLPPLLLGL